MRNKNSICWLEVYKIFYSYWAWICSKKVIVLAVANNSLAWLTWGQNLQSINTKKSQKLQESEYRETLWRNCVSPITRFTSSVFFEPLFTMQTMLHGDGGLQSNVWLSEKIANSWGFFSGGFLDPLQSHSNGLCKDPNDCVNHSKLLFGSFETCSRHIRNDSTAENYFLRLDFRKLSPENE